MKSAQYYIEKLDMTPHVEGGYFKESIVSKDFFREDKKLFSSIYFLLETGEVSNFHRLTSDEMWYYHDGQALTIYMITPDGELITKQLGLDIEKGEIPQVLVPKGYIFGSSMNNDGFALVGCMVAPAFTFDDFELFERKDLLNMYPHLEDVIKKLTR
ncbi:cupin domain-containing protein [Clostridium sp. CCUG 7971]|uniref:cupin domain-containing protein n=1 Tax=Clostridium sp. CCUG 7971 TaxID=2811414 RepID=UPI001ABA7276|nr:cupin domain-containing protein [Clostridium sp. CCUG 7971]MBO3444711.1 cupin domain-containing protein [Clostridium sp. CCUG 7971]